MEMVRNAELYSIAAILVALLNCFLGYRLFKVWTAVLGGLLGGGLGAALAGALGASQMVTVCAVVLPALLCGLAAFRIYKLGVLLVCGLGGVLLAGWALSMFQNVPTVVSVVVLVAAFVVMGSVGLRFMRPVIVLCTAFSGASTALALVFRLIGQDPEGWPCIAAAVVLGIVGCMVQLKTTARGPAL